MTIDFDHYKGYKKAGTVELRVIAPTYWCPPQKLKVVLRNLNIM